MRRHTEAARIPTEGRTALRVVVEARERAAAANMVEMSEKILCGGDDR